MLILYVEDDLEDAALFTDIIALVNPDIELIHTKNGREALDYLEESTMEPDCIFLDVNMPIMNGQEMLLSLQRDHRLKKIPVIIYTTSNVPSDKDRFLKMGAHQFVVKHSLLNQAVEGIKKVIYSLVDSKP